MTVTTNANPDPDLLRWVLLRHEIANDPELAHARPAATRPPQSHWDFMLEVSDGLLTWALCEPIKSGKKLSAESLATHRKVYLEYEGDISDDRGIVRQVDAGTFEWRCRDDARIVVGLKGGKMEGEVVLARVDSGNWTFEFREQQRQQFVIE
jgi:hypothetical protein